MREGTTKTMKVLYASVEVAPFSKVGGLADVAGSLPKFLKKEGAEVAVFTPLHGFIDEKRFFIKDVKNSELKIRFGFSENIFRLKKAKMPNSDVTIYFIENKKYFSPFKEVYPREIYGDYEQERFICFSRAILEYAKFLNFKPDVIHLNDWHTAMIAPYIKTVYNQDDFYKNAKLVYSIHNLAYQGIFYNDILNFAEIPFEKAFHLNALEYYDRVNWTKGAINYCDEVITVSPTYANEIMHGEMSERLGDTLRQNAHKIVGILNGIDYHSFNPSKDKALTANYSLKNPKNKIECKRQVMKEFWLEPDDNKPLIAFISRLVEQKGIDLINDVCEQLKSVPANFIILGTGERRYEDLMRYLHQTSSNIKVMIDFKADLGQRMYAGSDLFLMPSKFEPCGLSQLIAMKYGSIPIVRATGGLEDTICGYPLMNSNGFKFFDYNADRMLECIYKAIEVYHDKSTFKWLVKSAMEADFSWEKSANKYIDTYKKLLNIS